MAGLNKITLVLIVVVAVFSSLPITRRAARLVQLGLGIGKVIQPISDFPYQCRRLYDPRLQACEDLWLSESTRQVFIACSESKNRHKWIPNEGNFDLAARSTRDVVIVMDPETLEFKALPMHGFAGTENDGIINLTGFTGVDKSDGSIELFVTNFRPTTDPSTGKVLLDQAATGANATIEVFRTGPQANILEWVATIADSAITTPNRPAAVDGHGIYVTNDHGQHKTGWVSTLSPVLNTGNVAFCPLDHSVPCEIVSTGHGYPNGLIYSRLDQRIYLPSSAAGGIKVFNRDTDGCLDLFDEIDLPYAIDNLSEDQNGDLWAAVIPRGVDFMKHTREPFGLSPPSTVFRIRRGISGTGGMKVEKVLEDRDGEALPGTTTVVHDARTGRLFLAGCFSPFITVCEAVS